MRVHSGAKDLAETREARGTKAAGTVEADSGWQLCGRQVAAASSGALGDIVKGVSVVGIGVKSRLDESDGKFANIATRSVDLGDDARHDGDGQRSAATVVRLSFPDVRHAEAECGNVGVGPTAAVEHGDFCSGELALVGCSEGLLVVGSGEDVAVASAAWMQKSTLATVKKSSGSEGDILRYPYVSFGDTTCSSLLKPVTAVKRRRLQLNTLNKFQQRHSHPTLRM